MLHISNSKKWQNPGFFTKFLKSAFFEEKMALLVAKSFEA